MVAFVRALEVHLDRFRTGWFCSSFSVCLLDAGPRQGFLSGVERCCQTIRAQRRRLSLSMG